MSCRCARFTIALLATLVFTPAPARPWGCDGHTTIAFIAYEQLNDRARKAADSLLRRHPSRLQSFCSQTGLTRFAAASTWADDARGTREFAHTAEWHFLDIPRGAARQRVPALCPAGGCVTRAIAAQVEILTSKAKEKAKADALRFLLHFVGDVHQPLHCTTNGDRGGNCVPVRFFGARPTIDRNGKARPNLHSVWDTGILARARHFTNPRAFATRLAQQFRAEIPTWRAAPVDLDGWAWESHQLAERTTYGKLPTAIPVQPERDLGKSCIAAGDNVSKRMLAFGVTLKQPYQDAAEPVVEEQLAKAGTRLAVVLNRIWP